MTALRLTELELENFRCFESLHIDFDSQLTVLVAENGAGKSSVLDAIAVALGPYVGAFDEATGKHFMGGDIRQFRVRKTNSNEMEFASGGVWLRATGTIPALDGELEMPGMLKIWERRLTKPVHTKTTTKDAKVLSDYGVALQEAVRTPGDATVLPLVACYGTGRLWQQKNLTSRKSALEGGGIKRTSRTIGYTDCLDSSSSYKLFVDWFRYWNISAKSAKIAALEAKNEQIDTEFDAYIAAVAQAINGCLAPAGWKNIEYSVSKEALVAYHDDFGQLPVDSLSDGIRSMIAMVADIAFRATKLNGHLLGKAAIKTPGIVLIDEVDMHLHPLWQQQVLKNLTEAFPNVQFIVTTHSPQVLSAIGRNNIRLLWHDNSGGRWQATAPQVEVKGVESVAALRDVMGVDPVPPVDEADMIRDYLAKIELGSYWDDAGRNLRARLESIYGADSQVIRDADKLIRFHNFKQRVKQESKG